MRRLPFWKSSLALLSAVVLSTALIAGCNNQVRTEDKTYGTNEYFRKQGREVPSNDSGYNIRRVVPPAADRDDWMGRDQNPNMIIGHANVRNSQVDMNNMEMMARSVPGVENARITLNGGNAYVTLDLVPNITANQARTVEQQVIAALRQKVPRYDFHVTSNEGYHR